MKNALVVYYALRSVLLRGLPESLRLLRDERHFEVLFGLHTSGFVVAREQGAHHYQAAPYRPLLRILKAIFDLTGQVEFVDIGCGLGRALFVAEYTGYNNLTGVELNPELLDEARRNEARYRQKRESSVFRYVHGNATGLRYKDQNTVYFLFNPFDDHTLRKVIQSILQASASQLWLVYMNPVHQSVFSEFGIPEIKVIKTGLYTEAIFYRTG